MNNSLESLTTSNLHRCIDCQYCDVVNAVCVLNHKEYDLQDGDMWIYGDCEFFQERFEEWNKKDEENMI